MVTVRSHQKINIKLNIILLKITAFLFFIFFIFVNQAISQSFERGDEAADAGDFTTALKEWKPLAENGHVKAQFGLGLIYLNGEGGIPKDKSEAVKWFKKAAEQGSMDAQLILGLCHYKGIYFEKDMEKGFAIISKLSTQGFAQAQFELGLIYNDRYTMLHDADEAAKLWIRSAEQGFTPAMRELGKMFEKTGWLYDNLRMQEVGLMWSVIAMLRGDESAEFDVSKGEKNLSNESISRVRILVKDCIEKKFVGCESLPHLNE